MCVQVLVLIDSSVSECVGFSVHVEKRPVIFMCLSRIIWFDVDKSNGHICVAVLNNLVQTLKLLHPDDCQTGHRWQGEGVYLFFFFRLTLKVGCVSCYPTLSYSFTTFAGNWRDFLSMASCSFSSVQSLQSTGSTKRRERERENFCF